MIDKIYLIGIIVVTLIVLYLYFTNEQEHRREMDKIERLERKFYEKERELDFVRSRTTPCPIPGLDTPRKCYIDSNYLCTWNDLANRCDRKE